MRLLLLNPNTSAFVTARVAEQARHVASPGTHIVPVTASFGPRVISTRSELAIAEHATLDALARYAGDCDAAIIAASFDPALFAAREMLPIPVVGITEAAVLVSCMLGTCAGMVVFGSRMLPHYQAMVASYGLAQRVAGWRALDSDAPYSDTDQTGVDDLLLQAIDDLVRQDGCEVIVLAGAVMAGVPDRLQARVGVPLIEGVSCAVTQAEALVRLARPKASLGSLAPFGPRETIGLDPALRDRLSGASPDTVSGAGPST